MKLPYNIDSYNNITYNGAPIAELVDLPQKYKKIVCKALDMAYVNGQKDIQNDIKQLLDLHGIES